MKKALAGVLRFALACAAGLLAQAITLVITIVGSGTEAPDVFGHFFLTGRTMVWLLFVLAPALAVGEILMVRERKLRWQLHMPIMAGVFFTASFLLCGGQLLAGSQSGSLSAWQAITVAGLYGAEDAISGLIAWAVLRSIKP